jgi:transposase
MPAAYQLRLPEAERVTLEQMRAHHPKPFCRERAASLLAIAAGASIRQAARTAGLRPHKAATLCAWVARYQTAGLAGLQIQQGRGRKPASFPAERHRRARAGG